MTAYRYARVLGEDIGKTLGQTIVVDNDAGANGDIATRLLRRAAPDGYTLIVNTLSHNVHPLTQPDKLDAAIVAALAKPALRARLATLGADVKHLGRPSTATGCSTTAHAGPS